MDTVQAHDIFHLLDAEHQALGAVAAGAGLEEALAQLLLALQGDAGDVHGCVILIDEADRFCGFSAPSLPADLCLALQLDEEGPQPSPFGAAAFTGAPVYCGDIAREPGWSAGRKEAMLHGYRACWVAPVFGAHGHILGVLGLFSQLARHPTQLDIDTMTLAARCISHVIERARLERLAGHHAALEQRLQQRTAERDRLWRLATDIMLVTDLRGVIIAVNPAWSTLLARAESDTLGIDFLSLVHPDDLAAARRELARLAAGATTLRMENRYRRGEHDYRTIAWTAVPAEQLIHIVGRDVTEEQEAQLALQRSEQALLQAQKLESIGKLTGGVAHDFNNVLQIISGNLQLLKLTVAGNPQAASRLDSAESAVARGARLSLQLLAFARRQPLRPLATHLGHLLASMQELIRRAVGELIFEETFVSVGLWHVLVDPNQMENVLLNMAINARDAMAQGGRLTFSLSNITLDQAAVASHADALPGQYVLLTITDTGQGMDAQVIAQIFEPFFTTKKEGEGTGLGLSMAYGFIRQSGGHIRVQSAPGAGTTFKIYLPRSLEPLAAMPQWRAGPVLGGFETILVVEDDAAVRNTVVDMLRGLGYTVLQADDGESALRQLQAGASADLLFTDVVMPGPVGSTELARQARLLLPGLAVLFTSGYTYNAIMRDGRLAPSVELLSKPYRREDLARRIRHLLADRRLPGAPDPSGRRILLVEDNADAREMTMEMLNMLGHTVHGAASAEEAVPLLALPGLEILLTDISLPAMSGLELARLARAGSPPLAVILASGHGWAASVAHGSGARFLQKPFGLEELAGVLARLERG
ncbi:PAS domain S-box-containing protein [Janthinobacterium psychrotolerans]|uniref:histidine kinase n=2 Tax=Janthinobacterium psychrotolerans TaxID=1747903 RepID=A0A1A7BYN4_9BURK|nr:PAS domain S-box-containing protein [Janthinobacterium psychrotolerans]